MVFDQQIQTIKQYFLNLQNQICQMLVTEEGQENFVEDVWQHQLGGGGITRVITGEVIEKAGVNFSHVYGECLPQAATTRKPELSNSPFQALGVSVVVHPYNPFVPTSHFNVRFISVETTEQPVWWFGGGFDLTPYYPFAEDCIHWHQMAKNACDPFDEEIYSSYKKWADEYFYLKHRQEPRGIGGIFFDDLNINGLENSFEFIQSVSDHYIKAYQPILAKRKKHSFNQTHRDFQLYRRGRYVEFNLLYDRGTLFGLQSGGRTESILMSLPPMVAWQYQADTNKYEQDQKQLLAYLQQIKWV